MPPTHAFLAQMPRAETIAIAENAIAVARLLGHKMASTVAVGRWASTNDFAAFNALLLLATGGCNDTISEK